MHKYIPRVHIVRADDLMKINFCEFVTFSFEESEFIAVTAYQNEQVSSVPSSYINLRNGFIFRILLIYGSAFYLIIPFIGIGCGSRTTYNKPGCTGIPQLSFWEYNREGY